MKKYKLYRLLFLLYLISVSLTGCDFVHEFPDDNPVDPSLIDVSLTLSIDMHFESDTIFQTYATMLEGDYDVRYIVDIYEVNPNSTTYDVKNRIQRIVKTENNIVTNGIYDFKDTLKLPAKKYELIGWIDFVEKGTNTDKYYNTADLQQVSIILQNGQYEGYNTTKDAFTAQTEVDLTPYRKQRYVHYTTTMDMIRPFAVYRIITTDMEEYKTYHQSSYASVQPAWTKVLYNLYFPMGYNAFICSPENFLSGINYQFDVTDVVPGKEAIVASDYVFVGNDVFYQVNFEILGSDDNHINTVNNLRIDLKRNHVTVIRGQFLTKDLSNGGIGINDQFTDEIIIQI